NVKICSGRFSAGLGATVSWRGLMIGGGGSTTKRAAAEVIGTDGVGTTAWAEPELAPVPGLAGGCTGNDSTGLGGGAIAGRGVAGRNGALGAGAASLVPRKSLTRVSTSWLIEMLLVSQNAFSRSYVVRLTLMLRRVCFLAMVHPYATGRVSSRRPY